MSRERRKKVEAHKRNSASPPQREKIPGIFSRSARERRTRARRYGEHHSRLHARHEFLSHLPIFGRRNWVSCGRMCPGSMIAIHPRLVSSAVSRACFARPWPRPSSRGGHLCPLFAASRKTLRADGAQTGAAGGSALGSRTFDVSPRELPVVDVTHRRVFVASFLCNDHTMHASSRLASPRFASHRRDRGLAFREIIERNRRSHLSEARVAVRSLAIDFSTMNGMDERTNERTGRRRDGLMDVWMDGQAAR